MQAAAPKPLRTSLKVMSTAPPPRSRTVCLVTSLVLRRSLRAMELRPVPRLTRLGPKPTKRPETSRARLNPTSRTPRLRPSRPSTSLTRRSRTVLPRPRVVFRDGLAVATSRAMSVIHIKMRRWSGQGQCQGFPL